MPDFTVLPEVGEGEGDVGEGEGDVGEGEGDAGEGEGDVGEGEGEGDVGEGEGEGDFCAVPDVDIDWVRYSERFGGNFVSDADGNVWGVNFNNEVMRLVVVGAEVGDLTLTPDADRVSCPNVSGSFASIDVAPSGTRLVIAFRASDTVDAGRCFVDVVAGGLANPRTISLGRGSATPVTVFLDDDTVLSVVGDFTAPLLDRADIDTPAGTDQFAPPARIQPGRLALARLEPGFAAVLDDDGHLGVVATGGTLAPAVDFVDAAGSAAGAPVLAVGGGLVVGALAVDAIAQANAHDVVTGNVVVVDLGIDALTGVGPINTAALNEDGALALGGRAGWLLSRESPDAPLKPAPNGELLPEVVEMVIDADDTLWARGRNGMIAAWAHGAHPGSCNARGVATDVVEAELGRALFVIDGDAFISDDTKLTRLSLAAGQIDTSDVIDVLGVVGTRDPVMRVFTRGDGVHVGVTAAGKFVTVDFNTGVETRGDTGVTSTNLTQAPVVAVDVGGDAIVVIGYDNTADPVSGDLPYLMMSCDLVQFTCAPAGTLALSTGPDDVAVGAVFDGAKIVLSHGAGLSRFDLDGSNLVTQGRDFGERVSAPLQVGSCIFVAAAGNGSDDGTGVSAVTPTRLNLFASGPGDGEVDVIVVDGGRVLGSGRSGLFFDLGVPDGMCRLLAPEAIGTRADGFIPFSMAATPSGFVVTDSLAQVWLTHVGRPPLP